MLLRFGKLHCLGDDLMLVDTLAQHVQLEPAMIQQWSRRIQGVGFKRLVTVEIPRDPDADFDCRSYDRAGNEVISSFIDLCCTARYLHDKRLTNQPLLQLQTAGGRIAVHVRDDDWVSAGYAGLPRATTSIPEGVQPHLQQLAERYQLQLDWQVHGRQLLIWADQAPPQRLQRLLQPVLRRLRGWQLLWLHSQGESVRVQGWQADLEQAGSHDPVRLIVQAVQQRMQQPAVRVEWQQDCLLLELSPQQDAVQLFARAWPAYEGQIRI